MELHTKIAGVAFEGRAQYVRKIKVGQILRLRRNKDNPYDSNAIEVINTYSNMLGFIPKDIAAQLAPKIDEGCLYIAKVLSVTDNYIGEKVGAEILIQSIEQDEKLFTCCECGKQLSDRSNACPHCGCPTIETLKTIFRIEGTKILDLLDDSKRVVVIPQFITEISSGAFRDKTNIVPQ